jgi:hypothetical protein
LGLKKIVADQSKKWRKLLPPLSTSEKNGSNEMVPQVSTVFALSALLGERKEN